MSEMVERVARALFAHEQGSDEGWNGPLLAERGRDMWRKQARAAINAMREPTAGMMHVGSGFVYESWGHGPTIAKEAWQAVIDEALK